VLRLKLQIENKHNKLTISIQLKNQMNFKDNKFFFSNNKQIFKLKVGVFEGFIEVTKKLVVKHSFVNSLSIMSTNNCREKPMLKKYI